MQNLNYKQKLSLLHNLLNLTLVDQVESEVEIDFIYQIGEKLDVEKNDIDALLGADIDFAAPKAEDERIVLFYTFVLVMRIDGVVTPAEISFCKEIGLKMGLNPFAVNNLLKSIEANPTKQVPAVEVVNFFKLYHN